MASFNSLRTSAFDSASRAQNHRAHQMGLTAYERHKKFVHDYLTYYRGTLPDPNSTSATVKTDWDALHDRHRFLRTDDDDKDQTWEARLAKRYYGKLFKEYCLADLSRYKEGKVGMRWRTETEVIAGKGQFICGNKACSERKGLASFEVNFGYKEAGEYKQALVKLRVCPECSAKLNYKSNKYKRKTEATDGFTDKGQKRRRTQEAEPSLHDRGAGRSSNQSGHEELQAHGSCNATNKGGDKGCTDAAEADNSVWKAEKAAGGEEATMEEEFDKYFEDMFL